MKLSWQNNKYSLIIFIICTAVVFMLFDANPSHAINAVGKVHCDANQDGAMTPNDVLVEGIVVNVAGTSIVYSNSDTTDGTGFFAVPLLSTPQTYEETLDGASLPGDAVILVPSGGVYTLNVTDTSSDAGPNYWLYSSLSCVADVCGNGVLDAGEECDDGNLDDGDGCSANCTVEEHGGDGCTPGYWKNHPEEWGPTGLSPDDSFGEVFGCTLTDPDVTMMEALRSKGGGFKKCLRHGAAAMLNALHEAVDYPFTDGEVEALICAGRCDAGDLSNANELSDTCPAEN